MLLAAREIQYQHCIALVFNFYFPCVAPCSVYFYKIEEKKSVKRKKRRRNKKEYDGISLPIEIRWHNGEGSDCSLTFIMCIIVLVNNNHNNNISYN